ncbi:hypothetical protein CMV_028016, partial [Castanea mollissima]
LWTPKCLSYLAGGVGRPLYADALTEQHQRLGYARVCVEVGFDDELPDSLVVELPGGKILEVGIEYPWKPENVCIAKRLVGNGNDEGGLQEQVSILRTDDFSALQDKANISESVGGSVNDVVPVPLDTGIKDPNVAPVVSPNPRQGNRRVTRAQVAAGKKAEGCEEGAPGQFTLLEFLDAAIEKGAKLKPITTVKAKEKGKIVLNPIKKLIRDQRADLVYLVETKVRDRNGLQIKEALFPNWGFLNNYDNHELGRIWVCWNANIFHVLLVLKADQVIHWEVVFLSNPAKWEVPFVYGAYCGFKRQEPWQAISGLQWRTRDRPWVVLEDFNVVKDSSERFGGLGNPGDALHLYKSVSSAEEAFLRQKSQIMQKTHPEQLRMELQQEVTDREIQDTLFFMDGDKAHGPDGYTARFF